MPIHKSDEYDKVVNVSWYTPEKPRQELRSVDAYRKFPHLHLRNAGSPVFCLFRRCILCAALIYETSSISSTSSPMITSSISKLLMTPSSLYVNYLLCLHTCSLKF